MKKVTSTSDKEVKLLQDTLEELQEGMSSLVEWQKHICIADQSKCSWRAVAVYKSNGIGDGEEYNKQANKEPQDKMTQEKKFEGGERQ